MGLVLWAVLVCGMGMWRQDSPAVRVQLSTGALQMGSAAQVSRRPLVLHYHSATGLQLGVVINKGICLEMS